LVERVEPGQPVEGRSSDKDHSLQHPQELLEELVEEEQVFVHQWKVWQGAVMEEVGEQALRQVVEEDLVQVEENEWRYQSKYRRDLVLAHETLEHLCVLLLKQCQYRSLLRIHFHHQDQSWVYDFEVFLLG